MSKRQKSNPDQLLTPAYHPKLEEHKGDACFMIPVEAEGTRLDRHLRTQFPDLKQAFIEKSLRKGLIRVDGKKVSAGHRLTAGENIVIQESAIRGLLTLFELRGANHSNSEGYGPVTRSPKNVGGIPESWFLTPVWDDDDLLVINKPAGLAVQGGTKTSKHVDGLLQAYGAAAGQRYYLVHRLDRDTSGILVIAKNQATAQHLAEQFRLHSVKKLYLAIVLGVWKQQQGTIDAPLIKIGVSKQPGNVLFSVPTKPCPKAFRGLPDLEKSGFGDTHEKMVVDQEKGRHAKTDFRLVKRLTPALNLLTLTPQTGRTHQLRVHMQYIGHPIIGDGKYGGAPALKQTTQLHLHAYRLTIKDRQGTDLTFMAPWPAHFVQTITATGADPEQILANL